MASSSTRHKFENEMAWSWREWMGVNPSSRGDIAAGAGVDKGGAFLPEEANALYREVFDALQVPRRLSGPRRVRRGTFEIASEVFPAQFFSGDFVSVFDVGDATFLALGDIAGKGLTAAMWSTHILGLIRTYSAALKQPGAVLEAINRDLYALGSVPLTTAILAKLDWQNGILSCSNAGHCEGIVRRANGDLERLAAGGPVLGAIHGAEFKTEQSDFPVGSTLVCYSDGLIECQNDHEEEFGLDRLLDAIQSAAMLGAGKALFSIVGAVQDFAGGNPRADDLSLMVVGG